MRRTTLFLDEAVDRELHALARSRDVPVSALVRESLGRFLADENRSRGFALQFLGRGRSGRKEVSGRHEKLVWRDLSPHGAKDRRRKRG